MHPIKLTFLLPYLGIGGVEMHFLHLSNYFTKSYKEVEILYQNELDDGSYKRKFNKKVLFKQINLKGFIKSISIYSNYLDNSKPDLIIVAMYMEAIKIILARAISSHKPKIVINGSAHFSSLIKFSDSMVIKSFLRPMAKIFYPLADFFVCQSEGMKCDITSQINIPPERIKTIFNAVIEDQNIFQLSDIAFDPWDSSLNKPYQIIMAGRLVAQKCIAEFIEIFNILRKNENLRLLIMGEGNLKGQIEEKIEKYSLQNDIKIIPFQENFHCYLKQSDLMIVNSSYEGLNNMIIHSLACGTPIISRDCPSGPSEILEDGKFGHLVALGDDKKMIELIRREMKKSSFNSHDLVERSSAFSVSKAASEYNKVFLKCLNVNN